LACSWRLVASIKWRHIDGWSESVVEYIRTLELAAGK
jgi:hypothetical protein